MSQVTDPLLATLQHHQEGNDEKCPSPPCVHIPINYLLIGS